MLTIVDYKQRENSAGEKFFALIVQNGVELVKSNQSGRFYATARNASIPSTFDENTCKQLIGTQINGSIQRVECEPYDYTIPESGEVIQLNYRHEYVEEGATVEENVFQGEPS